MSADYFGYEYAPGSGLPLINIKVVAVNPATGVVLSTVYTDSTGKWDFGDLAVPPTIFAYTEFGVRVVRRGEIVGTIVSGVDIVTGGAVRAGATAVLTGDGYWIDYNAGTPRLRVGTVSGGALVKGVYWDGANLAWIGVNTSLTAAGLFTATNAVITGTITATLGAIGGWVIGADSLMDAAGVVGMSSAVTAGDDIRFWAGHVTPGSAPFKVTEAGALTATSATITGAITATSGTIGSFTIGTYLYTGSKTAWNDANAGVHLGSDGIGIGNNVFTVSAAGALVATSATITGTITASAGTIGGFTIYADYLTAGAGATAVVVDARGTWAFYAGSGDPSTAPFSVTAGGALVATSATITGAITATSGTIGSFTIGTYLYTGSKTAYNDANAGVHLGSDGIGIGNNVFTVSAAGALVATSATITGAITASSGTIGSFTIGTYLYTGSKTAWNDANAGVHLGSDGIGIGNNVFTVNGSTGALVATSATITGAITASSGSFSGVLSIGASGGIFQGTGTFASPTTALKIYNSGGVGLLEMWGSGVKQVYMSTDGKLYAGGGNVRLDSSGLWLANDTQILARNAANSADIQLIGLDATDIIHFGAAKLVYLNPATGGFFVTGDLYVGDPFVNFADHGAAQHTDVTRSIYLDAASFHYLNANVSLLAIGPDPNSYVNAVTQASTTSLGYIGTTFELPSDYVAGTAISVYVDWAIDDNNTAHNTRWYFGWRALADGEDINQVFDVQTGATIPVPSATVLTRKRSLVGSSSTALAVGRTMEFVISMARHEGGDDSTGTIYLLGVHIEYTASG